VVECDDESGGCGAKLVLTIVSDEFQGMLPLKRHRAINSLLKDELNQIHALTINAWTVKQYELKKSQQ
jgi:stress-induced morphogen